jgi:hypothetical protein
VAKFALLLSLAAIAVPIAASADIPSPARSSVDPCVVLCPAGDLALHVIVRNAADIPQPGSVVDLEFSACPEFHLCAPLGGEPYTHLSGSGFDLVRTTANGQGAAVLPVRAGGGCPAGLARVYADGVPLALRAIASPDQNGDGIVQALDATLLQSKIGTTDPTGDFDCDGMVTSADVAILNAHMGHACAQPTPVRPDTWGRLKMLYR